MDDNRNESFGINGHLLRKGGVKIFATSTKIKVKYYIRYVDSLRNGDRGRWREKEQIRQNAKKQKGSSFVMMAIVERGRVYEITNLLYLTLTRAQFSLDRRHPMLPDYSSARKLKRIQEMPRDKITLCFRLLA